MSRRRAAAAALAAALTAALAVATAAAIPILPIGAPPSLPAFSGKAAKARPITPPRPPQLRLLAPNPNSNIHNDAWMTDAYRRRGPLGRSLVTASAVGQPALCASLAFDRRGRIVSVCPSASLPPQARIIDPDSLETIASYTLPNAPDPAGTQTYQNFSGGGYFFLDRRDRIWVATKTNHLFVLAQTADGQGLVKVRDFDLTPVLDEETERITSALPDASGRIWFVSKAGGKVGTLDRRTRRLRVIRLGEEIENSFAVGGGGVYIVSDKRMYRFATRPNGRPRVVWRHRYRNSGVVKPSQVNAGSGTTPTLMNGGYVAITDNAEPMNVVVYRRAKRLRGRRRVVCEIPVFGRQRSATENSLITAGRSLIVENNYGYRNPFGPDSGAVTAPGFARIDVMRNGRGCRKVWVNRTARAPSVVPKASTRAGLIYTYTRPPDPSGAEGYYWTALDFRTGRTVWNRYAGSGLPFNNNYAGIAVGPDGTAYLGVIGGMISLRDGG